MPLPFIIIGALLIGLTLGLMGSGGSILTVPILVYVLGHDGKVAIAAIVVGWLVLNRWVLPAMGIGT